VRRLVCLLAYAACLCTLFAIVVRAQAVQSSSSNSAIVGVWTLNADLSDKPPSPQDSAARRGRSGGSGSGHGGRGGSGGGFGRGRGPDSGTRGGDDDERRRRMEAIRDLLIPPARLTITTTDTMVIITGGDGRTTRLLIDGTMVKDESTKSERRTRWLDGALVSEISGLASGAITQTFAPDTDHHHLRIVLKMEGRSNAGGQGSADTSADSADKGVRTITRVYEPGAVPTDAPR
jgi:hypothetical protein